MGGTLRARYHCQSAGPPTPQTSTDMKQPLQLRHHQSDALTDAVQWQRRPLGHSDAVLVGEEVKTSTDTPASGTHTPVSMC